MCVFVGTDPRVLLPRGDVCEQEWLPAGLPGGGDTRGGRQPTPVGADPRGVCTHQQDGQFTNTNKLCIGQ